MEPTMTSNCSYLYGVVPADQAKDFGPIGLDGEEVRTVSDGGIGIVISTAAPVAFFEIPPEKTLQYLAHHQRVLERVMLDCTVVPVKFGTFCEKARDDAEVVRILRCGGKEFAGALESYAGKAEFDVAVSWADLKSILAEIARDETVVSMKARIDNHAEATVEQRVRLGQLVKELLDRKNKATAERLLVTLRTKWRNIVVNPTRDDSAVLNAAVLIDRAEQAEFDRVLEQLNRSYDDRLTFRRVGPLPPYSFATAEVKTVQASRLDAARRLLGLGESASLAEIKGAYRRMLQELHPDRNTRAGAAERLQDISAAHELLEEYALNFKHTFNAAQVSPVIVTVRSLDDLLAKGAGAKVSMGRDPSRRGDCVGAAAA
jgi:DnaJ-domain-containing protein 1